MAVSENSRGHLMHQTDTRLESAGFSPLHPDEHDGLFGYRRNATPGDLLDAATHRQNAAIGVLHALSGAPNLNELNSGILCQCFEALLVLCSDAQALHS